MNQFQDSWSKILHETRKKAITLPLKDQKFIIFSDLHMGNGGSRDDFRRNVQPFYEILRGYYFQENYHLILNGDIEELHKIKFKQIRKHWTHHFELFNAFHREKRLTRLFGNHESFKITRQPEKTENELRAYESSPREGIISIIGHTHRPLFESMSRADSLKYRLDSLI